MLNYMCAVKVIHVIVYVRFKLSLRLKQQQKHEVCS